MRNTRPPTTKSTILDTAIVFFLLPSFGSCVSIGRLQCWSSITCHFDAVNIMTQSSLGYSAQPLLTYLSTHFVVPHTYTMPIPLYQNRHLEESPEIMTSSVKGIRRLKVEREGAGNKTSRLDGLEWRHKNDKYGKRSCLVSSRCPPIHVV